MVTLRDAIMVGVFLLILGIALSIGSDIQISIGEKSEATAFSNETVALTTSGAYVIPANMPLSGVTDISNDTHIIPTDLWTWEKYTGIQLNGNETFGNRNYNVSYSAWIDEPYNVASNASAGMKALASWSDTISLMVAAVIIIGLLFGIFVQRQSAGI